MAGTPLLLVRGLLIISFRTVDAHRRTNTETSNGTQTLINNGRNEKRRRMINSCRQRHQEEPE